MICRSKEIVQETKSVENGSFKSSGTVLKGIFEDDNLRENYNQKTEKETPESIIASYDDKSLYPDIIYENGEYIERDYNLKRKKWYK